ncbi:AAA family ATPase [Hydrogenophaga sp.]|uniref:UvrD-helicase domain-containing protein n=1 Tax=Hydrogenophaga sp. TaxID=1904254 RepID=UPI00272296DF|nr:AAA family ATPase [Hydrogenophaga sp.]MDO9505460.1 AAA family ATPase [Hydrogenophaga sp.]
MGSHSAFRGRAGSGKTTSLIKALERVVERHGQSMLMKRQRIACINYTEVAANEIREDVAAQNLVHVSTIHSFYWTIASTFQADIKAWVLKALQEHLGLPPVSRTHPMT